jgi:hypothetical protein
MEYKKTIKLLEFHRTGVLSKSTLNVDRKVHQNRKAKLNEGNAQERIGQIAEKFIYNPI